MDSTVNCSLAEIFKYLAPQVENPNAPGPGGLTPLQMAAIHGSTEILKFLTCQKNESTKPRENH